MAEGLTLDRDGGIATITMRAPERRNALTLAMAAAMIEACETIDGDRAIGAVIVTGEGGYFCAGGDRATLAQAGEDPAAPEVYEGMSTIYGAFARVGRLEPPTIAAIRGGALGAGLNLALATDLRVASDRASFMQAFSRVGLMPDAGSNYFLPRLVGLPKALEMAWTARRVGAEEALALGMVNRVVPAEDLGREARALAEQLARGPALSIALTKQAMLRGTEASLDEILALEAELQARCIVTPDFEEGVAAFVEKRDPQFGKATTASA
jgi:enoyl-CoA hydratase/carnithine racemase